jgi:sarcosine oxidase subunit alpha
VGVLRREDPVEPIGFHFDDQAVDAQPGDTISTALIDARLLMTSRSPKYRRPRGPYCLSGDCGTCLVRVDGQPNVRACMTAVLPDIHVEPQNTFRPKGLDPTQLVDRMFSGGFDHHRFMVKPKIANTIMQTVARELAGFGELPVRALDQPVRHEHHEVAAFVLGQGSAGRAAARVLADAGIDVFAIDRHDAESLRAIDELPWPDTALTSTGVFAAYAGERLWAMQSTGPDGIVLRTVRAQSVLLAMGSRDPMLPFPNNDVPGVMSARGLVRALRRVRAKLEEPPVVVGHGPVAQDCAEELDAELVHPDKVESVTGSRRVEGLALRTGRKIRCQFVAVAGPASAASELAAQAGAALRFDGAGYVISRDESGRAGRFGDTQLWATGDVTGWKGPLAARRDGERVAQQIVRHQKVRRRDG